MGQYYRFVNKIRNEESQIPLPFNFGLPWAKALESYDAEEVEAMFRFALDSLPVKRLIESAKGSTKLIDATNGRRTRAVIVTGSDHLILSSLEPATLAQRLGTDRSPGE